MCKQQSATKNTNCFAAALIADYTQAMGKLSNVRTSVRALVIGLCLTQSSIAWSDQSADSTELAEQIRQTDIKLKALQDTIERNTQLREELHEAFTQAQDKRAERHTRLAELDARIQHFDGRIQELERSISTAQSDVAQRKQTLSSALRNSQSIGSNSALQSLFQHDDPAKAQRLAVYKRYVFDAQKKQITSAARYLERIEQARQTARKDRNWLNHIRGKAHGQALEQELRAMDKRQQIDTVEQTLENSTRSVAQLQRDQQRLQALMRKLEQNRREGSGYFTALKGKLEHPVSGELTARFAQAKSVGKLRWEGWFIETEPGRAVNAVADGEVVYSDWLQGFGMLVIVDHGDGYMTLYAGNQSVMPVAGAWVESGSTIALTGDSGGQNMTGLYFEIRRNAQALDPQDWLTAASS